MTYGEKVKVSRACDGVVLFLMALAMDRGNRSEAESYVAETRATAEAIVQTEPKAFNRQVENLWRPWVDALGVLAWAWFAVTAILAGTCVALVPLALGRGVSGAIVIGLLLSPSTALCASRAMGRHVLIHALKNRRIDRRTVPRASGWLSDSITALLALLAWCGWAVMLSL